MKDFKATRFSEGISKPVVIIIAGPTGVGKTALAIRLAKQFETEIISADSRQCYREMSIGTATPSEEELSEVKHYFINSHSVQDKITAFDFEKYALATLNKIFLKTATAIVCGGTGLYIKALCEGMDEMPETDELLMFQLDKEFREKGKKWLQQTLAEEDPLFFISAEQDNPARLLRALAFIRSTGQSITHFRTGTKKERPFHIVKIGLDLPRPELYARINQRVDKMMAAGLEAEVRSLLPYRELKNLNTVGYSELFAFFEGQYSLTNAVEKIKQHSRNYAKRQLTWFRKDSDFHWFPAFEEEAIMAFLKEQGTC